MDGTAASCLSDIVLDLHVHKTILLFACVKGPVREVMLRSDLVNLIGPNNFFWELHDAVMQGDEIVTSLNNEQGSTRTLLEYIDSRTAKEVISDSKLNDAKPFTHHVFEE